MPISNTVNFLPPYLQTVANRRFLSGTLDLLVNAPELTRFDGYIGRQFYNGTLLDGNYLLEQTPIRQNYQLEAAFVSYDQNQNITGTANFLDVLNSCASKDAVTSAWNRLLTGGVYSWQSFVDLDKLVNYQNYCWISQLSENGNSWFWENPVTISATNVSTEIIGQETYTDSTSIILMNGMNVEFSEATDSPYNTGSWIVDGLVSSIVLIPTSTFIVTPFAEKQNNPADYLVINRASADLNLWSRSNFWFSKATINYTIEILAEQNPSFVLPTQEILPATRPIIEFVPLLLYSLGKIGTVPTTYFDNYTTDAFSIVQGTTSFVVDGYQLNDGDTVIFNADQNIQVRNKIYTVNFIDTSLATQIPRLYPVQAASNTLFTSAEMFGLPVVDGYQTQNNDRILLLGQTTPSENGIWTVSNTTTGWVQESVTEQSGVLVLYGNTFQQTYWIFNPSSSVWSATTNIPVIQLQELVTASAENSSVILSGNSFGGYTAVFGTNIWSIANQNKTSVNQAPLFDVFDINGISFSDTVKYPSSSFTGSKLFSYAIGTGEPDTVLGFPLTYGPVGNINDVIFDNNYATDTFSYYAITTPVNVYSGKPHTINPISLLESSYDCWQYCDTNLELYQNIVSTGSNVISFSGNLLTKGSRKNSQQTQVFVDGTLLGSDQFTVSQTNGTITVTIAEAVGSSSTVLIKILSTTAIPGAWYDVPLAFDHNPFGQNLDTFNMGQIRNHTTTAQENADNPQGNFTLQLPIYSGVPGSILFQQSLAILPTLLLCNSVCDIDQALKTAGQDYTLFKQSFLNNVTQISNQQNLSVKQLVDAALQATAQANNISQPWATSDMCFWGGAVQSVTVQNTNQNTFNLTLSYSWSQPNAQELLVYLNDKQLILNSDYSVSGMVLTILTTLSINDVVSIYEIANTNGSYIPATPTKLGLAAAYLPQMYVDYTYQTPRTVIQGHDGSITTAYGDIRDAALLDYELRVYNNLKVNNQLWVDTIEKNTPAGGRWRSELGTSNVTIAPYSPSELLTIQQRMFYEWAAEYNVNFINSYYTANDLFTWNWSSSLDKLSDHQSLLGYWRGIYNWFYDTNNPNTRPWEMLNLAQKPVWWDSTYGSAPYTGGNAVMWNDIANGFIRDPLNPRYSSYGPRCFSSNSVLQVVPVDSSGNLLDPNDSVVGVYNESSAANDFVFGDGGPGETAWRTSSVYPFARLRAQILQNPLFMLGTLWDTNNYLPTVGAEQFRYQQAYLGSVSQVQLNSVDNNGTARVNSIINYSIEYMRRQGQDPSQLRTNLNNTQAQLMYPLGGYSSVNDLTAYAAPDNPNDVGAAELIAVYDYALFLNQSTPIATLNYSGLIVSLAPNNRGFQITGYNRLNPFFTIYPPNIYGPSNTVGVSPNLFQYPLSFLSTPQVVAYNTVFPTVQSVIDFIAGYEQYLTSNGLTFTVNTNQGQIDWSGAAVQFVKWSLTDYGTQPALSIVLNPSASIVQYTANSGTLYSLTDPLDSLVLDSGGLAVLPKYLDVYRSGNNVVITNQAGGVFGCIATDIVSYEHRLVFNNLTAFDDTIYDPISAIRQTRLQLSGQKSANWNGTLDSPGFLICSKTVDAWVPNQDYLMGSLVQFKNNNYVATQDTIGSTTFQYENFQLISTVFSDTILPNLALKATDYNQAYNINYRPFLTDLVTLRNNTIGYIERDWLSALDIDAGAQTDFYKGWVKEKGTLNALNSYGRGSTPQLNTAVVINEEYAMKVGVYGADSRTGYGDVSLPPSVNVKNPIVISFVDTPSTADTTSVQVVPSSLYEKSSNWTNNFGQNYGNLQLNESAFQTAGPVLPTTFANLAANIIPGFVSTDTNSLFFANISSMFTANQASILKIAENGGSFWIENNPQALGPNQWDVITFDSTTTGIVQIQTLGSNTISFILNNNIGAVVNSAIIVDWVDGTSNISINGVFPVSSYSIAPFNTGTITGYSNLCVSTSNTYQFGNISISYSPTAVTSDIFVSRSLRSESIAESNIALQDTNRYVTNSAFGEAAYELNSPYQSEITYPDSVGGVAISSMAYDATQEILWFGKATAGTGLNPSGVLQVRPIGSSLSSTGVLSPSIATQIFSIESHNPNTSALGKTVVAAEGFAAAAANNQAGSGQIYICGGSASSTPSLNQILSGDTSSSNVSIVNLCMSNDSKWLYAVTDNVVSGNSAIAAYALVENPYASTTNWPTYGIGAISNSSIQLNNPVAYITRNGANIFDAYSICINVSNNISYTNQILIPGLDYNVINQTVYLNSPIPNLGNSAIYTVSVTGLSEYYRYQGTIQCPGYSNINQFGSSFACDSTGTVLAVGAPTAGFGEVSVINRIIENQYCAASVQSVTLYNAFTQVVSVSVAGSVLPINTYNVSTNPITGNVSVSFYNLLPAGTVITVEGSCFSSPQTITSPSGLDREFGSSVAIQNNQLVIGSSNTPSGNVSQKGATYLYALDTAITSEKIVPLTSFYPVSTPFMLNGWVITPASSSVSAIVSAINASTNYTGVSATVINSYVENSVLINSPALQLNINPALQTTGLVFE